MLIGPDLLRINHCDRPRLTDRSTGSIITTLEEEGGVRIFLQLQEADVSDR